MRLLTAVFVCVSVGFFVSEVVCDEAAAREKLKKILQKASKASLERIWRYEEEIKRLEEEEGDDAVNAITKMRESVPAKVRLLLDKTLIVLGMYHSAIKDLCRVALDEKVDREVRLAAVTLLMRHASKRQTRKLRKKSDKVKDAIVRIHLLRLFFHKLKDTDALRELRKFVTSGDADVQAEAAIALAREDEFETTKEILERLKDEPTARGALVRSLLAQNMLMR
ncbi:MAG: hypothetical protein DRP63_08695, partial [Planctomycetota bacterium]